MYVCVCMYVCMYVCMLFSTSADVSPLLRTDKCMCIHTYVIYKVVFTPL